MGRPFVNQKYQQSQVIRRQRPPKLETNQIVAFAYAELEREDKIMIDMQTDRLIAATRGMGVFGAHELLLKLGQYLNRNPGIVGSRDDYLAT